MKALLTLALIVSASLVSLPSMAKSADTQLAVKPDQVQTITVKWATKVNTFGTCLENAHLTKQMDKTCPKLELQTVSYDRVYKGKYTARYQIHQLEV